MTYNIVYMFEIFYVESSAGLKAGNNTYDNFHFTKFEFRWWEKESIICGEVYFQHKWNLSVSCTYTHTSLYFSWKQEIKSITSVMKKKMWTNIITCWLERWFSQRQVENNSNTILNVFSMRRPNGTPHVLLNLKHSLLSLY